MIYIQYLIGAAVYSQLAVLSYSKTLQSKSWYLPIGLALAIIANLVWLIIAKRESNPNSLLIKGLIWDCILTGCYLLIPLILVDVKLTSTQIFGIILIVCGIILTKL